MRTDLFGTEELLYCFVGLLISTLFGYLILRQISMGIARVERRMARRIEHLAGVRAVGDNEIKNISMFADLMSENIKNADLNLGRRMSEIHALKELESLSVLQVGAKSLTRIALERAVEVVGASGGAILLVTGSNGICLSVSGESIRLQEEQSFSAEGFPLKMAEQKKGPLVFSAQQLQEWSDYFEDGCSTAILLYIGSFAETSAFALLVGDSEQQWDDAILSFLGTYFPAVGNKVKMLEIDKKEKRTSDELKTVLSIISILNSNPKEEDILAVIAKKVEQVLSYRWIGIVLENSETGNLYLSHSFTKLAIRVKTGRVLNGKNSIFHLAVHEDEPFSVERLDERSFYENRLFARLGLKSALFAQLSSGGRPMGVICFGRGGVSRFSSREKRLSSLVAKAVSVALDQSRSLARERAKRTELEILNKIGGALSSHTIKANRILPYVLNRVVELVEVEAASIMMMEFDALQVEAAYGVFRKEILNQRFKLDHGVAGYVVVTGEPVSIENVKDHPDFSSAVDEKTGFETRTLLCVPMISGGRVIGVIELLNRIGKPFSEEDMQTVRAVAASVAIALENTRLYSESNFIAEKEKYIRSVFQRYVPEEIVADILQSDEQEWTDAGRKKVVTIFNVDIRGYTRLSRQASSEDVVFILNYFFKQMGQIVLRHKGVVDKYLGDGMLAIFGAPVETANPALDAVLAAKEMVAAVEAVSRLSLERCGSPISIGIAINTGEAIVGSIGFSKKMEYTVIGDVVNEAFRIQDLTRGKKNMILIGGATQQQVSSMIETIRHGTHALDISQEYVYEVVVSDDELSARKGPYRSDKIVQLR